MIYFIFRIMITWGFLGLIWGSNCKTFKIGALMSDGFPPEVSVEAIAPALKLAIEDFQKTGSLSEHNFEIVWANDHCYPKLGVHLAVKFWRQEDIDVVIGSLCSHVVSAVSHYLTVWDVPIITHGGSDSLLNDKVAYNTLVRIGPDYGKLGAALIELYKALGWRKTVLINSDHIVCLYGATVIHEIFPPNGIEITEWIRTRPLPLAQELDDYMTRIKKRARIILLCLDFPAVKDFMLRAHKHGITSPEYSIIVYCTYPVEMFKVPWLIDLRHGATESEIQARKKAFFNYKLVWMAGMTTVKVSEFKDKIPTRLFESPWTQYNGSLEKGIRGSIFAVFLYEATYAYLHLLNETLQEGGDYRSGVNMFNKARNRTFEGMMSGSVSMDNNADREPDFRMLYYEPGNGELHEDIEISLVKPHGKRVYSLYNKTYWGTQDNKAPPDTPICGFYHELCPRVHVKSMRFDISATLDDDVHQKSRKTKEYKTAISSTMAAFLTTIIILGGIFAAYRKKRLEAKINQMIWKINIGDVKRYKRGLGSMLTMSLKSFRDNESMSNSHRSCSDCEDQVFIEQGEFRGNAVAMKFIPTSRVVLKRQDLIELKILKQMNHPNVNPFIGACIDPPNVCILSQYCTKGSLQDILEQDSISLEWMFRVSLMMDLAKGLTFLHHSPIESHGNLRSSNCLVDNRWVLKISSFGLHGIVGCKTASTEKVSEYKKYRRMLWTAPELLRMKEKPRNGTKKGDAYSFAIILQEMIYREQPFFMHESEPKDIVEKVVDETNEPFRPVMPSQFTEEQRPAIALMQTCWAENPIERPDLGKCLSQLKKCIRGRNTNLMDIMVQRLEKYANNLEDIVGQRTRELVEEKKRTDSLLGRMLPKSVVEELKKGKTVKPQLYDEVTVFFSDIVGFTTLSSESTPMQIVNFLNDLYTLFDDIIQQYDVYKVETIGDAYMVVSGLPERNEKRHSSEIACMALDLLRAVKTNFRIRHKTERRLELRSGIHTGPCAAGVVGLTMPRYCLFGDTVNMASRMESNGEALKIHLSRYTHDHLEEIGGFLMEMRGVIEIKGKGSHTTFWLHGKNGGDQRI